MALIRATEGDPPEPRSPSQKSQPLICAAPVGPESDICGDVVIETRRKCSIYRRHSDSVEPEIRANWTYETGSKVLGLRSSSKKATSGQLSTLDGGKIAPKRSRGAMHTQKSAERSS